MFDSGSEQDDYKVTGLAGVMTILYGGVQLDYWMVAFQRGAGINADENPDDAKTKPWKAIDLKLKKLHTGASREVSTE
jgi:hypothetical protein